MKLVTNPYDLEAWNVLVREAQVSTLTLLFSSFLTFNFVIGQYSTQYEELGL